VVFVSVKEVADKAQHFSVHEQMIIGINYCLGLNGHEQDTNKGRAWLWIAATYYRSFIAQYNWALTWTSKPCYKVEKDISLEELQILANENNLAAIYMLGVHFREPDPILAIEYYQKAAKENFYPAINNLADIYENGSGVEQDINKAVELYNIAAEQGIAAAEWSLGLLYFNGDLVDQNIPLAQYWLQKAEANGWFPAQDLLISIDENYQKI